MGCFPSPKPDGAKRLPAIRNRCITGFVPDRALADKVARSLSPGTEVVSLVPSAAAESQLPCVATST